MCLPSFYVFFSGKRSDVYKILELSMYAYKSEQKVKYNCRTSLMKQKERSKAPIKSFWK